MGGGTPPQTNQIARPAPPAAPQPRAMDTYDEPVARAFTAKEAAFFGTHAHDKDEVISVLSPYGHFKIDTYPNQGNANDVHHVVFFYNKATKETFEVHGTIARAYIAAVRGLSGVRDFPISDSREYRADRNDGISYFSQYTLRWERATNNVIRKLYKPYDPAQATVQARLHDYDPPTKTTLVGYTEEYTIASNVLNFSNWKDEADLGKYNGSIGVRAVGMPTQILLHETAGFADMSIPNVRQETTSDGRTYHPIPHFCVNKLDDRGSGNIIQFVDVATNVPHGEVTNERAVGIEFVNPPIEAFAPDASGQRQPVFKLETSERGVYLKTKLAGLPKLFIPLEFSAEPRGCSEIALRKDRLLNFATLNAGVGPAKTKVVFEHGENVLIKYAKSDMFEHLATLVSALVASRLVKNIDNLATEAFWKPFVATDSGQFYLFQAGWEKRQEGTHYFVDVREPGLFTHLLIGGHVDGGLQGLYLFLKFVKRVPVESILQLMVHFLTSDKSAAETARIQLTSKVLVAGGAVQTPATPIQKSFGDILEIDQSMIDASMP